MATDDALAGRLSTFSRTTVRHSRSRHGTARLISPVADPERLGRALITNVPFLVNAFFRIITPLLDPVTREKMRFNPACIKDGLFTPEMLMKEWGGAREFEYDHEQYWSALVKMCDERRMRMMDAWRSQGSSVGIKEWEVKCAIDDHEQGTGVMEQEKTQAITESVGEEIIVS